MTPNNRPMRTATHFIDQGDRVVALCDTNGEVQYMIDGPAAIHVAQDVLIYMDSPYRCDKVVAAIGRHPSCRVVWSAYPMPFAPKWVFHDEYACGADAAQGATE